MRPPRPCLLRSPPSLPSCNPPPDAAHPQALLSRDPFAGPHGEGCTSFDAALQRFLGSSQFYVPALPQPRGAASAVRDAFRQAGGDLDAGFEALRTLQVRCRCLFLPPVNNARVSYGLTPLLLLTRLL